jgi:naphtho-gamma-pyrone polyketide synthase
MLDPHAFHIILFGDSTVAFEDDLRQLLHHKVNGSLQSLFDGASLVFRREFASLPVDRRAWLPQFTTLLDLLDRLEGTVGAPALKSGLLCLYQIARIIV